MKVAIVYPEVYDIARFGKKRKEFPPFGVLYLATIVSMQNNMEVKVMSVESDENSLDLSDFDVVAFSIPSSVTYDIMRVVRYQSVYAEDALLVAGGVHAQIFPEQTLQEIQVSAVCTGQGDEVILELLNQKMTRCFSEVKGICYKNGENILFTEKRVLKRNLDHLPIIPVRDLLPDPEFILNDRLAGTSLRMTHVMFSQGCPFVCNFCASQQQRMQYRSGWHIRQELEYLKSIHRVEGFAVVGDNFLVNKHKVREICSSIADLNLKWSTLSRVDTVDYDTLEALYDAGCIEIKFGVESGSDVILKAMSKSVTVNQIYNAIRMTHSVGIGVKVFIIHGYPGENLQTTRETITMLDDLSSMIERVSLFRFVPLPGSPAWGDVGRSQLLLTDDMTKCHIHHNPHHWWGSSDDFAIVEESYKELDEFIVKKWG